MIEVNDKVRIMGSFKIPGSSVRAVNPSGVVVSATQGYCKVQTRYGDIELYGRDVGLAQHRRCAPQVTQYRVVSHYHASGHVSTWIAYENVSRNDPNTHISDRVFATFEAAQREAESLRR